MRETWARRLALLTGLLVLLLSAAFAVLQNPAPPEEPGRPERPERPPAAALDSSQIVLGREVYEQQFCAACHAVAGVGAPRNPLDGVGGRYSAGELRDRITGADSLRGSFPDHVLDRKQRYRTLPEDQLDALVAYLQTL